MKVTRQGQVRLLGHDGQVEHRVNDAGQLVIVPPPQTSGAHAFAFRLTGFDISLHPDARFTFPDTLTLEPAGATLQGRGIKTQTNEGRENIGYWDDPSEKIHWLVWVERPGTWQVRAEFSCAGGPSRLKLTIAGQSPTVEAPRTPGWFKPVFAHFPGVTIDRPGVYRITLESAEPSAWKPVNVYQVQLTPTQ
jgi:hypothetical protein